jgi:hypothetical protein
MAILPRTPDALEALEQALCECHGDLLAACQAIGANFREACLWRDADPEVAERMRVAQVMGWATLENAAYKRAVHGVDKNVYYQGEVVGTEKVYSDGLLTQMMKARLPAYGEDAAARNPVTVNVAVMPRANSYEDWVMQRERMLSGDAASGQVPGPEDARPPERVLPASQQVIEQWPDAGKVDVQQRLRNAERIARILGGSQQPAQQAVGERLNADASQPKDAKRLNKLPDL